MATLEHLNGDTTWLLSVPCSTGVFNILIDPWLSGWHIEHSGFFFKQEHVVASSVASIPELQARLPEGQKVDAILICHDFPDHCHLETLQQADRGTPIFANPYAAKRLKGWSLFDNVFEIPVARLGRKGVAPEEKSLRALGKDTPNDGCLPDTISVLQIPTDRRFEMTGKRLHAATILTFRLPCKEISEYSVVYAPHGTSPISLNSWVASHSSVKCLALVHGLDEVDNPWYLAGPLNLGLRSGIPLCRSLRPQKWIRTHDEVTRAKGLIAKTLKRRPRSEEACTTLLKKEGVQETEVFVLDSGEQVNLMA